MPLSCVRLAVPAGSKLLTTRVHASPRSLAFRLFRVPFARAEQQEAQRGREPIDNEPIFSKPLFHFFCCRRSLSPSIISAVTVLFLSLCHKGCQPERVPSSFLHRSVCEYTPDGSSPCARVCKSAALSYPSAQRPSGAFLAGRLCSQSVKSLPNGKLCLGLAVG